MHEQHMNNKNDHVDSPGAPGVPLRLVPARLLVLDEIDRSEAGRGAPDQAGDAGGRLCADIVGQPAQALVPCLKPETTTPQGGHA